MKKRLWGKVVDVAPSPLTVGGWYKIVDRKTGLPVRFRGPFYCYRLEPEKHHAFCLDAGGNQRLFTLSEHRFRRCTLTGRIEGGR